MSIEELAKLLKKIVAKKENRIKQVILSAKERDFLENHLDKMLKRRQCSSS